ncbi:deoxyguanosinetriphosphate triphosphohydrolase-like protein [Sphaerisporangium melleum]|uniref:Deoxyguanosinetriphosphate triphosphohydrolase-like protein n=1 Tax=Sphaerisporangium melleum TaxID=321316 RepID=A0A917QQ02_9ACTN|nr:deoxyguanosinetriphosphate triphosphohydrolase [Sphaerisporangium melleum]GGK62804.1 deoxyguanosinetriphosphate triphosphohydrolase-like protein [Sphaerisporangium melleum]GII68009.1 deoxyguanosinetriphosphate triphosphohydrolase-like protein [Sphaerisporangium melleum]
MSGYDDFDQARWVPEPAGNPERSAFERDRARVLHSAALRRLAAKTQVVGPGEIPDHGRHIPRTRLTHSLECAQIGREMGKALGCDPDLVETACLAHDLGHPPFGHNGEKALDELARRCGGFEGNAQSLRLLTRLEAKVLGAGGHSAGLNLTRATLDSSLKYPWTAVHGPKYGVYLDDLPVFEWIRQGVPEGRVSFEAQIMDWSDDVAYSVHDLEDALHSGHLTPRRLLDPGERREVCERTLKYYAGDSGMDELEETLVRLVTEPLWPARFEETMADLVALKSFTSALIGRFCLSAQRATIAAYGRGRTRHRADLIVPRDTRLECALLKGVTAHYVMSRADHHANQARQRELITELASMIMLGAPGTLEPALRPAFADAADDAARLRVVVDQIASLTDVSAVALHRTLSSRC